MSLLALYFKFPSSIYRVTWTNDQFSRYESKNFIETILHTNSYHYQGSSGMRMDTDAWNSANAVQRNVSMMAPRYSTPPTMPAQQVPTNRGNGLLPSLFKYYLPVQRKSYTIQIEKEYEDDFQCPVKS